jgi:hypothetical protein
MNKAEVEKMTDEQRMKLERRAGVLYLRLIVPLRAKAKELGYALCVHGSLKRDIDLVAVPWSGKAAEPRVLAFSLQNVAQEHNDGIAFVLPTENNEYHNAGEPGHKPHGRLCWSFHLGGGPYIDLSVFPPATDCICCDEVSIMSALICGLADTGQKHLGVDIKALAGAMFKEKKA